MSKRSKRNLLLDQETSNTGTDEQPGKPSVEAVRERLGLTDEPTTVSGDRSRFADALHKASASVKADSPVAAAIDAIAKLDVSADVKADLVKAALAANTPRPVGNARRHRSNLNYSADPIRHKAPRPGSKRHGVMTLLSTTPSTLDEVAEYINANYAFANAWNRTTAREGVSLLATVHGYGLVTDASGRTSLVDPSREPADEDGNVVVDPVAVKQAGDPD